MVDVEFKCKVDTVPGDRVVVAGGHSNIGSWDPHKSKVELATGPESYPWWSGKGNVSGEVEYKFVVLGGGGNARWEASIKNRKVHVNGGGSIKVEAIFDKEGATTSSLNGQGEQAKGGYPTHPQQPPCQFQPQLQPQPAAPQAPPPQAQAPSPVTPAPAKAKAPEKPPHHEEVAKLPASRGADAPPSAIVENISNENNKRKSWRNKLDLTRTLLEGGQVTELNELACLQAYLTWVASGQIKCEEDGGHHRPCAHADASRKITAMLWQFAARGDAERFIARRIFPALPSYADQFTCAVPMTRIRDIAHRNDIPHDLKQEIKHTLQNKLHRCADPGDLVTCERLIQKCRNANCYSEHFMREFEIFYKELKEFFNAGGLDEQANQMANSDGSLRPAVDKLMHLKHSYGRAEDQLQAVSELRALVAPRAEAEQMALLLDLELERYAFVQLSQLAGEMEHQSPGSQDWWGRLLNALVISLKQSELSSIGVDECRAVASDIAAACADVRDSTKAPFVWLRLNAAADRALRICFALTQSLEAAYNYVPALGSALHIDQHAVSVFVEAEMRTSILFQVSKFIQMVLQQSKRAANLPLWVAISAGTVIGKTLHCNNLNDVWNKKLPEEGAIVFCNEAGGDEELPALCRGVVVARDLPVLSHLALRARQLGAVFCCTTERPLFDELKAAAGDGSPAKLVVEATGDSKLTKVSECELKKVGSSGKKEGVTSGTTTTTSNKNGKKKEVASFSSAVTKVTPVIEIGGKADVAGSKASSSGKLESIAKKSGFKAPTGLAIPFGVMTSAVYNKSIDELVEKLKQALEKGSKIDDFVPKLRQAVEACTVPKAVIDDIAKGLPKGTQRVAVRSSANSEDLEGVSGAGLHDSVLGVSATDPEELEKAVQTVWSSMFTLRAIQSRYAAGMPLFRGVAMGVLIQPMVYMEGKCFAFIAFSKHVVENDAGSVYMEVCVGLGETLASANEPGTPYRLVVQKAKPNAVKILSLASFSRALEAHTHRSSVVLHARCQPSSETGRRGRSNCQEHRLLQGKAEH